MNAFSRELSKQIPTNNQISRVQNARFVIGLSCCRCKRACGWAIHSPAGSNPNHEGLPHD
jgi:hypothetical protein